MTELEVAAAVAGLILPAPYAFANSFYLPMRLSGTGAAFRPSIGEFVWREPTLWLGAEMQRRVLGLPAIMEHPPGDALDAEQFVRRVVGIITYSYVINQELWGVCRMFDAAIAEALTHADGQYVIDTSPGVVFDAADTSRITLDDGATLLVEGSPSLIDHIAIIATAPGVVGGVWSKGDISNPGIEQQE